MSEFSSQLSGASSIGVNICYRPLRIGWAIKSGDVSAFRKVVGLNHTLWGGRYNPILVADREPEARQLVDLFGIDVILSVGSDPAVTAFPTLFEHLSDPLRGSIFVGDPKSDDPIHEPRAQVLDMVNALEFWADKQDLDILLKAGPVEATWDPSDPLAYVFLVQLGAYPPVQETGVDYAAEFRGVLSPTPVALSPSEPIPGNVWAHPTIAALTWYGVERHYGRSFRAERGGFFVGDASDFEDLVSLWNLRAADVDLWFLDPKHFGRYSGLAPEWTSLVRPRRPDMIDPGQVGIWSRGSELPDLKPLVGDVTLSLHRASPYSWNGLNLRPPMMHLGETRALGLLAPLYGKRSVSFQLTDRPYSTQAEFSSQHLVASVSFVGRLYDDDERTLSPPYLTELNEFYCRTMHTNPDSVRVDTDRVGLIVNATDADEYLAALPVLEILKQIFRLAGFEARPSGPGLLAKQLIAQVGGLMGARSLKIAGVRALLKSHGPTTAFSLKEALGMIGSPSAYDDLWLAEGQKASDMASKDLLAHLVEKRLVRLGYELLCPNCQLESWVSVDAVAEFAACDFCGHSYDATPQLVRRWWSYRRSGVVGREANSLGAVPVVLTLQQLDANMGTLNESFYSISLDLFPPGKPDEKREIDFVWVMPHSYQGSTDVILGECKDRGSVPLNEFEKDVEFLRRVGAALKRPRLRVFYLFSKLAEFSDEEVRLAGSLNGDGEPRTILLTDRELEPYRIYAKTKVAFPQIKGYSGTPEELAKTTSQIYFAPRAQRAGT